LYLQFSIGEKDFKARWKTSFTLEGEGDIFFFADLEGIEIGAAIWRSEGKVSNR